MFGRKGYRGVCRRKALAYSGYLPVSVKHEDRVAYYSAFTSFHRDKDAVPMTRIFLKAEKTRLAEWLCLLREEAS